MIEAAIPVGPRPLVSPFPEPSESTRMPWLVPQHLGRVLEQNRRNVILRLGWWNLHLQFTNHESVCTTNFFLPVLLASPISSRVRGLLHWRQAAYRDAATPSIESANESLLDRFLVAMLRFSDTLWKIKAAAILSNSS